MKRRDFLKVPVASAVAMALGPSPMHAMSEDSGRRAKLPRRPYGKGGIELSIIGFGGIVVMDAEQEHANRVVAEAVERGINYFDVAPSYGDAEVKLGPALQPYRKDVFLAGKTGERKADAAKVEFAKSLEHLRTDHFDLYQLHGITDVAKDVDAAFAADGVMPWLIEQKKAGRIEHLGFSAHSVSAALTALDRYAFDSILWPVNFAAYFKGDFGPQVVAKARAQGASVLALKMLAKQRWPENHPERARFSKCWYEPLTDPEQAMLALRFTLGEPVTAALPPGDESLWRLAADLALDLAPLPPADRDRLAAMSRDLNPIFTDA